MIKLTFLGTGTSQGVPMIACPCEVCHSTDPRDKRLRTSALLEVEREGEMLRGCLDFATERISAPARGVFAPDDRGIGVPTASEAGVKSTGTGAERPTVANCKQPLNIAIDAGPDFRGQMLAAGVTRLDAILLTHEHKDHTGGIDDVRAFNYFGQTPIDIWATERVQEAVRKDYYYAFEEHPYPGAPEIALHTIGDGPFPVKGIEVVPVFGRHLRLPVTGFRIGRLAYLTDFNHIEPGEIEKLRGVEVLVVNALGHKPHISHFNLEQALELAHEVGAQRTFLTHLSHRMGRYADIQPTLPEGVCLAYDGLTIDLRP